VRFWGRGRSQRDPPLSYPKDQRENKEVENMKPDGLGFGKE
jgi:hypothetical protein